MLTRAKACCLLVRLKSNFPACELRVTGTAALNLYPAVFKPSPIVKSLAGYLAAAAPKTCIAAGFTPELGNRAVICAPVSVRGEAADAVQFAGVMGGVHPL